MTQPDDVDAAVRAVVEQGVRLGLQWRTIPATVKGTPDDVNNVALTLDGDSVVSRAQSLVGQVFDGQRVMVLIVPPSTNYVIGVAPTGGGTAVTRYASENTTLSDAHSTYTALSPTCGIDFIAPPSGLVLINYSATIHGSSATAFGLLAPQVRQGSTVGSGTVIYAASDNDALQVTNTVDMSFGKEIPVPGLTPGAPYNVELLVRSNGTGTYGRRKVIVKPA